MSSCITHEHGKVAAYSYAFEIMATYAYVAIMVFHTIAIAIGCSKTIVNSIEGSAHLTRDRGARTANLPHLFSILFAVVLLVATAMK